MLLLERRGSFLYHTDCKAGNPVYKYLVCGNFDSVKDGVGWRVEDPVVFKVTVNPGKLNPRKKIWNFLSDFRKRLVTVPRSILWAQNLRINKTKIGQSRIKTKFASSFELQQITKSEITLHSPNSLVLQVFAEVGLGFFPCVFSN